MDKKIKTVKKLGSTVPRMRLQGGWRGGLDAPGLRLKKERKKCLKEPLPKSKKTKCNSSENQGGAMSKLDSTFWGIASGEVRFVV